MQRVDNMQVSHFHSRHSVRYRTLRSQFALIWHRLLSIVRRPSSQPGGTLPPVGGVTLGVYSHQTFLKNSDSLRCGYCERRGCGYAFAFPPAEWLIERWKLKNDFLPSDISEVTR